MLALVDEPARVDEPIVEAPAEEISDGALRLWEAFLEAIPRMGVAVTFIVAGWLLSRLARAGLHRLWRKEHTESFARVMSKLAAWFILGTFILAAITVTFPSVKPVDLLAGFGFFSIAIGFAFQDILENTLSGVLLLFREPFHSGDQISVEGAEGTVEAITIRETRITTFDGRLVLIPNSDVYKNAIVVRTANEMRREDFVVGVAYEADLDEVCELAVTIAKDVDGVESGADGAKAPEAIVEELGASTVNVRVRFWTDPFQHNVVTVKSAVIKAVKRAMEDAGVEMPCDIVALQATNSFAAAVNGRDVTPGGSVAA